MSKKLSFIDKFEKYALENKLLAKGDHILVGFSGGADSTALISALWQLRTKYKLSILVAHVNYNLRGKDSLADAEFVKNFCFKRNISIVINETKLKAKSGMEVKARELRFTWFNQLLQMYKMDKIALGHNKKDQAETLIFRLMRGSGYAGLKGITANADGVIHPLLPFHREEIEQFLKDNKLEWREDKSNLGTAFSRNKIRNELLPWVETNLNPNVVERLCATADIFAETNSIMEDLAVRRLHKATLKHSTTDYLLSIPTLLKTKSVLRYYVYKLVYQDLIQHDKDFYQASVSEIDAVLNSSGSKRIDLPNGVIALKEYDKLLFTLDDPTESVDVNNLKEFTSIRHRGTFEDYRIIMKKLKKLPAGKYIFEDENCAYLDFDKIEMPLIMRHRKPGDRFMPMGMKNSKKLKDFFIDEKIPKFERDKVVLLCDKEKILWVSGHRIDNRVNVTKDTQNILMIKFEKITTKRPRAAERVKKD